MPGIERVVDRLAGGAAGVNRDRIGTGRMNQPESIAANGVRLGIAPRDGRRVADDALHVERQPLGEQLVGLDAGVDPRIAQPSPERTDVVGLDLPPRAEDAHAGDHVERPAPGVVPTMTPDPNARLQRRAGEDHLGACRLDGGNEGRAVEAAAPLHAVAVHVPLEERGLDMERHRPRAAAPADLDERSHGAPRDPQLLAQAEVVRIMIAVVVDDLAGDAPDVERLDARVEAGVISRGQARVLGRHRGGAGPQRGQGNRRQHTRTHAVQARRRTTASRR